MKPVLELLFQIVLLWSIIFVIWVMMYDASVFAYQTTKNTLIQKHIYLVVVLLNHVGYMLLFFSNRRKLPKIEKSKSANHADRKKQITSVSHRRAGKAGKKSMASA